MSQELIAVLVICGAVIVIAAVAVTPIVVKTVSREYMRMVATCDDRVKGDRAHADRAISRIMAAAFPNSHATFRNLSGGTTDGAQYPTKPHYLEEAAASDMVAEKRKEYDDLVERSKEIRAAMAAEVGLAAPTPIGTTLDFERNGR